MLRPRCSSLSFVVFVLAACAGEDQPVASASPIEAPSAHALDAEPPEPEGTDDATDEDDEDAPRSDSTTEEPAAGTIDDARVQDAIAALSKSLGVAPADVKVSSFEEGRWSSSAAGCPEPGRKNLPRILAGYRVVLAHGGREFHYHGVGTKPARLCENPRPEAFYPDEAE